MQTALAGHVAVVVIAVEIAVAVQVVVIIVTSLERLVQAAGAVDVHVVTIVIQPARQLVRMIVAVNVPEDAKTIVKVDVALGVTDVSQRVATIHAQIPAQTDVILLV